LRPDHHHGLVEAGIERDQHPGNRSAQTRERPGQGIDRVQVDAALRRQQRVLSCRAHAHAPAPEAQECEQPAIDHGGHHHHQRRAGRDRGAAEQPDRGVGEMQRLQRMLLRRRPDQHDQAAQQNADRDRGEDGRQHHLAGHLAHQQHVDENADREAHDHRHRDRGEGVADEQRCRWCKEIGAEHGDLAMGHVNTRLTR
jgi:hypothetical protein